METMAPIVNGSAEDHNDMPTLECSDDDSSDSNDFSNDEDMLNSEPTKCLFCDNVMTSVELAITHLKKAHSFDLFLLKSKFNMDQYSYIKMINFIRMNKTAPEFFDAIDKVEWNDEKYLKPIEYEPWLVYDFESPLIQTPDVQKAEGSINNNEDQCQKLAKMVSSLLSQIQEKDALLEQAAEDIAKMRKGFQRLIEKDTDEKPRNCVSGVSLKADEGYFSSYSHYGIHHEMLSDSVRTSTYRDALLTNKEYLSGKTVLDVGCGTSVLSMFAAQAGALEVVGIDNSDIIYNAMHFIKKNNFNNITLIKGRLEDTNLPIEKFDIIISEWMGYFLFFEGMLDTVIYAREKHLKPGGTLMPSRCSLSLMGYGDEEFYKNHITFWDSVYGIDMSSMKKEIQHEPIIEVCKPEHILTDVNLLAEYDLNSIGLDYSNFDYDFSLKCFKAGIMTAFVGYFDTIFELPNTVKFSTSPFDTPTHWKQVRFLLKKPVTVTKNQIITGRLTCRRSKSSVRSLDIKIKSCGMELTYFLD